jgi:hypothetical protein
MHGIFWSENPMKANGNVEEADLKERGTRGGLQWIHLVQDRVQ